MDIALKLKIILFIFLIASEIAIADSPFLVDNPDVLDYREYVIYLFSTIDRNNQALEEPQLSAPIVEFDYGPFDNLEFDLDIPFAWALPPPVPFAQGMGDIYLTVRYRFIQEKQRRPQIGFAPVLYFPTGSARRNLGNGKFWVQLPIWAQKSWGPWKAYGGMGYAINSAQNMKNYLFGGCVVQKDLNERWTIGAQIFTQGAVSPLTRAFTLFSVGAYCNFTKTFTLLFSIGHSVFGESHFNSYVGVYWSGYF